MERFLAVFAVIVTVVTVWHYEHRPAAHCTGCACVPDVPNDGAGTSSNVTVMRRTAA